MGLLRSVVKRVVPGPLRRVLRSRVARPSQDPKGLAELAFWRSWVSQQGAEPETEYYRKFMMRMGNIEDQGFFNERVCLDIGCGPKGSLSWLTNARLSIGLDPLAEAYTQLGVAKHDMVYLCARAEQMPFPERSVDVVFSMNSLDHVDDLPSACGEIRRILRPGGFFIGSLNLDEPATATEPWTLTEELLEQILFANWERQFYRVRPRVNSPEHFGPYKYFFEDCPQEMMAKPGPRALWCRFRVPPEVPGLRVT